MLNGEIRGHGGDHILRDIDCKIHRGAGAIKEVLNAKNGILTGAQSPNKQTNIV